MLQARVPNVRFVVAGRNPSPALCRWLAGIPGVEVTGTVSDMRAEVAKATVCVVPLRLGSGTRLKILEAGGMAKAVISTSIGAEGLDLVNGEEIVLADEPSEFAEAVTCLITDANLRASIGRAAQIRVLKDYSIHALRAALSSALSQFAQLKKS